MKKLTLLLLFCVMTCGSVSCTSTKHPNTGTAGGIYSGSVAGKNPT